MLKRFSIHKDSDRSADLKPEILSRPILYGATCPETWMTNEMLPENPRPASPVAILPLGERAKYLGFSRFSSDSVPGSKRMREPSLSSSSSSSDDEIILRKKKRKVAPVG